MLAQYMPNQWNGLPVIIPRHRKHKDGDHGVSCMVPEWSNENLTASRSLGNEG
jgi:hypothetical protein